MGGRARNRGGERLLKFPLPEGVALISKSESGCRNQECCFLTSGSKDPRT